MARGRRVSWLNSWRSQGSELAEWRSQVIELAESAAGCRTVKSGCRTEPAQAVHISISELWLSHWKGLQPSGCIACVVSGCQCSRCFNVRLLQKMSQAAGKSTLVGTTLQWDNGWWRDGQRCTVTVHRRWGQRVTWRMRGYCYGSTLDAGPVGACCKQRAGREG